METFTPIAKINVVRILISLVVNLDWPLLHQFDMKNAYLVERRRGGKKWWGLQVFFPPLQNYPVSSNVSSLFFFFFFPLYVNGFSQSNTRQMEPLNNSKLY